MTRSIALLVALAPLSSVARAGGARGDLPVSCEVVPSAAFSADLVPSGAGPRQGVVAVASRARGSPGWFVSTPGDAVLVRAAAGRVPEAAPAGSAPVVVVTVFPDGAPERVVFLDGAAGEGT